jgi:hypothetical protein
MEGGFGEGVDVLWEFGEEGMEELADMVLEGGDGL